MAKPSRRSRRAERRATERARARGRDVEGGGRGPSAPSDGPSWRSIGAVGGAIAAVVVIAAVVFGGGGGNGASNITSVESATMLVTAVENAGGSTISVHEGNAHTVLHADDPLPTASSPRPDGRNTLVWFSGTCCHFCERMEPFAHETAAQFGEQFVFMEKSVDHDCGAASPYGVRGTPTFVLIDAAGAELARFFYQEGPSAFGGAILDALSRAG